MLKFFKSFKAASPGPMPGSLAWRSGAESKDSSCWKGLLVGFNKGVSENWGYLILGVLIIRILLFRVLY